MKCIKKKLNTGDYSLEGYEDRIAFERKSINDLITSVSITNKLRFMSCLNRLAELDHGYIIIDGLAMDVIKGSPYAGVNGSRILDTFLRMCMIHYLTPIFSVSRLHSEFFIYKLFSNFK